MDTVSRLGVRERFKSVSLDRITHCRNAAVKILCLKEAEKFWLSFRKVNASKGHHIYEVSWPIYNVFTQIDGQNNAH